MKAEIKLADKIGDWIQDGKQHPFFESEWPKRERLSFNQAGELFGLSDEIDSIHQRLGFLREIEETVIPPIVGVIGGKNAGKSSFVSGFLSDAGRRRVLSGEGFEAGTQRFVLWLPQKFKDDDGVRDALDQVFTDSFGNKAEELPENTAAAYQAYQKGDSFDQPLVAFDSALDELGFCFLDTPDFQTAYDSSDLEPSAHLRFGWIRKSARLLQGVVFVVSRSDIGNQIFSMTENFLASEMKDFPRYLCLNKIRKPQPDLIDDADVVKAIKCFGAKKTFGAFDFDIRNSEEWMPQTGEALRLTERTAPVFFDLKLKEFGASINQESLLTHELRSLDESTLLSTNRARAISRLNQEIESTKTNLLQRIDSHQEELRQTVEGLSDQLESMIPPDDANFIRMTPKLQEYLGSAIRNAAPFYVKSFYLSEKFCMKVMNKLKAASNFFQVPLVKEWLSAKSKSEPSKGVCGLLTPETFADMSFKCKPTSDLAYDDLLHAWVAIIDNLNVELNEATKSTLDQEAIALWQGLSLWKKVVLTASNLALVGVLVAPLALLATAPVITIGGAVFAQLSVAELFIGAGGGAAGGAIMGKVIGGDALKKTLDSFSRLQRLQLYCLAYDAFHLPRNRGDNKATANSPLYGQSEPLQPHLELMKPAIKGKPSDWSIENVLNDYDKQAEDAV